MRLFSLTLLFLTIFSYGVSATDFPQNKDHITSLSQVENIDAPQGATESPPRKLLRIALNLIKDFEGWSTTAYNDAAMYCTIGYGHLIAKARCHDIKLGNFANAMLPKDGLVLLEGDTVYARSAVQKLVKRELNHEQFGALASFVFNVGESNFAKSTMLRLLNNNEYTAAATQFDRWVSAKGVTYKGLIDRRSCEKALFLGRLKYNEDHYFNRATCVTAGATPNTDKLVDVYTGE